MNKELVEQAASAVRKRYSGASSSAEKTEALILRRLQPRASRRPWLPMSAIPLVAALLASAAWGTVTGNLGAALRAVSHALSTKHNGSSSQALVLSSLYHPAQQLDASSAAPTPDAPVTPDVPLTPEASVQELPRARTRARLPAVAPRAARPPMAAAPVPPVAPDPDALFRVANRAQFSGHDPAAAVALWDRYLSAVPNGSLTPEARYNRAIALAQTGQKAQAAAALEPFVRGDYGSYRRAEAQQLLKALSQ
ncbi:MAG: hypothetical protein ABI548_22210 [Polyangiaceae bacterium]